MVQDWGDPKTAVTWDQNNTVANPLRTEQLDLLLSILVNTFEPNTWMCDLGYGSGQVEARIFELLPQAQIVGVDQSDAMMQLAEERLRPYQRQFKSIKGHIGDLQSIGLPGHPYQHVIAIQSLHHLSQAEMQTTYRYIYSLLNPGGLFLLLDRMRVESPSLWPLYRVVWERLDQLHSTTVAAHEGNSFDDHVRIVQNRGDYPVLLDEHIDWLRQAGFEVACLHAHGNRALLAARKPDA